MYRLLVVRRVSLEKTITITDGANSVIQIALMKTKATTAVQVMRSGEPFKTPPRIQSDLTLLSSIREAQQQ